METKGLLTRAQRLSIGPGHERVESRSHFHNQFLYILFNILSSIPRRVSLRVLIAI
jgi:hypothetical protein